MDGGRGLSGSKWAPQNSGAGNARRGEVSPARKITHGFTLDMDWDCNSCGFSNFGWRKECFRCDKPKGWIPTDVSAALHRNDENWPPGTNGNGNGKASSFFGLSNGVGEPYNMNGRSGAGTPVEVDEKTGNAPRGALSMSIWAPRNRVNSQKYGDKPWTRVCASPLYRLQIYKISQLIYCFLRSLITLRPRLNLQADHAPHPTSASHTRYNISFCR